MALSLTTTTFRTIRLLWKSAHRSTTATSVAWSATVVPFCETQKFSKVESAFWLAYQCSHLCTRFFGMCKDHLRFWPNVSCEVSLMCTCQQADHRWQCCASFLSRTRDKSISGRTKNCQIASSAFSYSRRKTCLLRHVLLPRHGQNHTSWVLS